MSGQSTSVPNSPVDDVTFNLLSVLHTKLEGLAAYKRYLQDAKGNEGCQRLFEQLSQQDAKQAEMIVQHLKEHMGQGH